MNSRGNRNNRNRNRQGDGLGVRRGGGRRRRTNTNNGSSGRERQLTLYRSPRPPRNLFTSSPFAPFMIKWLRYLDLSFVLQGASSFLIREFRITSPFDMDPALGGGSPAGLAQLSTIYQFMRVLKNTIQYNLSNNEANIAITHGIVFRDAQPSTEITTYAQAQDALEVAYTSGPHLLGRSNGMSNYRSPTYRVDPGVLLGDPDNYYTDNDYASTVIAVPAQVLWCAIILLGPTSATNLNNGAIITCMIGALTRFYSQRGILGANRRRELKAIEFNNEALKVSTLTEEFLNLTVQ